VGQPFEISEADALNLLPFGDVPPAQGLKLLVIVPRGHQALHDLLKRDAEGVDWVEVVYDRRSGPASDAAPATDDRRRWKPADDELLWRGWTQVWVRARVEAREAR
jgi:hypothetical protein